MNTFSNNGQKPQFSVILWPQEGQNLASMAKKWKFELDLVNTFLNNSQKPPFSVIVWPLQGQTLANMIQKRFNTQHSNNKYTYKFWIGLHEYFFR